MSKNYIGVDIGGTSIKIGLIDENGNIIDKFFYLVDNNENQEDMIEELEKKLLYFFDLNKLEIKDVEGIGIGCPGSINSKTGVCDYSNNLKWNNLKIVEILKKHINLPIKISNDANAATLGEYRFGVGKGYKNIIMLTLGTGVGGGIIIDGKLYEGEDGKGAELGHSVIKLNGRECTCGRKGCIEAYASVSALIKDTYNLAKDHKESILFKDLERLNGQIILSAAESGDSIANDAINQYCYFLGEAILNYCNIFRPQLIILGGGISAKKDILLNRLIPYLETEHYGFSNTTKVELKCAKLGNDAGIIGAASLIIE